MGTDPDIRFRGGYNRAIRAPSIDELYAPRPSVPAVRRILAGERQSGGLVNGHTFAFCANTGVTAAEFGHILANPAAQINTSVGGNPNLTPEKADTYTAGFVFQPSFLPNFVASVDYYDIKIQNTITSLSSNTIVNNCGLTGLASLCALIHRGAGTGSLWFNNTDFVNADEVNIGTVSTKGVDVESHYLYDIGAMGKLTFNLAGTYTNCFDTQPLPTSASYDCVGYYGTTCGAPDPEVASCVRNHLGHAVVGSRYDLAVALHRTLRIPTGPVRIRSCRRRIWRPTRTSAATPTWTSRRRSRSAAPSTSGWA